MARSCSGQRQCDAVRCARPLRPCGCCKAKRGAEEDAMYSEALRRRLACLMRPPAPCDASRRGLTRRVRMACMAIRQCLERVGVSQAVTCRFQGDADAQDFTRTTSGTALCIRTRDDILAMPSSRTSAPRCVPPARITRHTNSASSTAARGKARHHVSIGEPIAARGFYFCVPASRRMRGLENAARDVAVLARLSRHTMAC